MSEPLLGFRWVRALLHDPEVRADFEKWLIEFRTWTLQELTSEGDPVKLHRLQGKLLIAQEIEAFVKAVANEHPASSDKSSANGEG